MILIMHARVEVQVQGRSVSKCRERQEFELKGKYWNTLQGKLFSTVQTVRKVDTRILLK